MRLQFQQQMQRDALLQQQQKERLLQQQQKQSLVVPVNATANAEQLCKFYKEFAQSFWQNARNFASLNDGYYRSNVTNDVRVGCVFPDLSSGMSNYELLNNVPPNVSLQRSSNVVPDTQLSPGFSPNLLQQQLSPNQRAPFSPQSNQNIGGYQSFNANTGQNQVGFFFRSILIGDFFFF